ncbi:MAG: multicopper oxidase family protein [Alphaproteobacteria bacterium]
MHTDNDTRLSRRDLFKGGVGLALTAMAPAWPARASNVRDYRLVAGAARVALVGAPHPETATWSYDGQTPGRELRLRQGIRLRVTVENRLAEETTVHWHGLRVPNAMDGVPHLTQRPIAPGETYVYEFDAPDAGTYWYHPHMRGIEQVGRGLYGPLIVEEPEPLHVDRDLTWVLDDWRLMADAQISDDFGNRHDISHNGRVGNTVTVNGHIVETVEVKAGERVRLRLINAANARIFGLEFSGHRPQIIAYDGQPVTPHDVPSGRIVLGPAMRIDVIIDMTNRPGDRFTVTDSFYKDLEYRLLDLVYHDKPLRDRPLEAPIELAANTMPEPDLANAETHDIAFGGGMMGAMRMAMMDDRQVDIREMMRQGKAWAIKGVAATGHVMDPLLTLKRGRSYVLRLDNDTAWHHPMHFHGHSFRVINRDGRPTPHQEWRDTVLMAPHERVDIAFVADNPGDWMFHCHILEHMVGGMMGVIRVT